MVASAQGIAEYRPSGAPPATTAAISRRPEAVLNFNSRVAFARNQE
jgi:hypothetical protein